MSLFVKSLAMTSNYICQTTNLTLLSKMNKNVDVVLILWARLKYEHHSIKICSRYKIKD